MEAFFFILEAILAAVDMLFAAADIYSWIKGKPNRIERKEARQEGLEPPPRDKWNRRVIGLTLGVGITTIVLIIVYAARR